MDDKLVNIFRNTEVRYPSHTHTLISTVFQYMYVCVYVTGIAVCVIVCVCEHQLKTMYLLIFNGIMRMGDLFPTCSPTRDL